MDKNITIREAQIKRIELEQAIDNLLLQFVDETGLEIDKVDYATERFVPLGHLPTKRFQIRVTLPQ